MTAACSTATAPGDASRSRVAPPGTTASGGPAAGATGNLDLSASPAVTAFPRHTGAAVVLPPGAPPPGPRAGELLDAGAMVTAAEVTLACPTKEPLVPARLSGIPRSATYDSLHLRPGAPERGHGVAVQVWRFPDEAAARKAYDRDLARYVGARATGEIGAASFRAYRAGIQYVHFLATSERAVLSVTCGTEVCSPRVAVSRTAETGLDALDWKCLLDLSRKAATRIPAAR